jgi:hypothetical protein
MTAVISVADDMARMMRDFTIPAFQNLTPAPLTVTTTVITAIAAPLELTRRMMVFMSNSPFLWHHSAVVSLLPVGNHSHRRSDSRERKQ